MIILDPLIIYVFTILFWIWFRGNHYIKNKRHFNLIKEIIIHLFFVYLLAVSYLTMRPFYFINVLAEERSISFDLNLFYNLLNMADGYLMFQLLYSVGNIMLFVPFGLLTPILFRHTRNFFIILILGFIFSLTIELTQATFTPTRYGTVDDLLFNSSGTIIGYILFLIIRATSKKITLLRLNMSVDKGKG
ncbi:MULTISPECIES: VanZ family protein [Paraliobacillus]|uniref:VanZ family protein n=1 Tax=Paraliobacillus TaxID=200903 RepID=UPI000DD38E0C|nr:MULTISPECIES: VanZ family protein [Paraliobacillus]